MSDAQLLDAMQLSEILHVARQTLYEWAREKKIPSIKIGACVRFDRKKIEEWLEKHQRK